MLQFREATGETRDHYPNPNCSFFFVQSFIRKGETTFGVQSFKNKNQSIKLQLHEFDCQSFTKADSNIPSKLFEEFSMKNSKQLNPNWAQLCQKLGYGSELSSKKSGKETQESILGKRKERYDDGEANECEMNVLTPTSSDSSITDAIAMDCEMVGVSPLGNKSALGRVTLVNKFGNVVYDKHVRPVERVVDFRTQISGIRPHDLKKAKDFRVVQKEVAELLKGRILIGHALRNDLKALLLSHPKKDIRDTAEYQPFLKEGRSKALRHLAAEVLGVKIQNGEHCPIEDARAAMMLYMKKKREWEKNVKDLIKMKLKQKKRKPRGAKYASRTL